MDHKFFSDNRRKLGEAVQSNAPIVLPANGLLQQSRDEAYRFYQDNNFWYMTGIEEPDIVLVIDESGEYLILPTRTQFLEDSYGPIDIDGLRRTSGIKDILDQKQGWGRLRSHIKKDNRIATVKPLPAYIPQLGILTNPSHARVLRKIRSIQPGIETIDIRSQLSGLRSVKTPEEIKRIRKAVQETVKLHEALEGKLGQYKTESEIVKEIRLFALKRDLGLAFTPIVASGRNATILHYNSSRDRIDSKAPLLIDAGLSFGRYRADITRTHLLSPTKKQREIYEVASDVQRQVISHLKPGVTLNQLQEETKKLLGQYSKYMPHRVAHFLGLDAHDPGDPDQPLKPGMIITVEPGIYLKEESIGVRVEDDVLITDKSHENLSDPN